MSKIKIIYANPSPKESNATPAYGLAQETNESPITASMGINVPKLFGILV